jgi:hypothetical protein
VWVKTRPPTEAASIVRVGIKPQLALWYDSLPYGFSC